MIHTVNFPVKKFATRNLDIVNSITGSTLWQLQKTVFDSIREVRQALYRDGMVPVNEARVEIEVRVVQDAVSVEASPEGKTIFVPTGTPYVTVAHNAKFNTLLDSV